MALSMLQAFVFCVASFRGYLSRKRVLNFFQRKQYLQNVLHEVLFCERRVFGGLVVLADNVAPQSAAANRRAAEREARGTRLNAFLWFLVHMLLHRRRKRKPLCNNSFI